LNVFGKNWTQLSKDELFKMLDLPTAEEELKTEEKKISKSKTVKVSSDTNPEYLFVKGKEVKTEDVISAWEAYKALDAGAKARLFFDGI
jgi:hypothetical protein